MGLLKFITSTTGLPVSTVTVNLKFCAPTRRVAQKPIHKKAYDWRQDFQETKKRVYEWTMTKG
jgi:hypothetical protein